MQRKKTRKKAAPHLPLFGQRFCASLVLICFFALSAAPVAAQIDNDPPSLEEVQKQLEEQRHLIVEQRQMLQEQAAQLRQQQDQIDALRYRKSRVAAESKPAKQKRAAKSEKEPLNGKAEVVPQNRTFTQEDGAADSVEQKSPPQIQALADQGGILTPRGSLAYEGTMEYTNSTRNLFSFNGVELAQVVLVGELNANSVRHDMVTHTSRLRLGITDKLEADVRVPFVYRNDALTNTTASTGATTKTSVDGYNMGDIDGGLAYQFNKGNNGWPFLIGNLRYKANNADGPYDVPYDSSGNATRLPTGTGFQTVETSLTAIKVTDPAILFGNIGYVYDMSRDINRTVNTTYIGRVEPGDAINALVGVAFAINPDTSFSLGYKHSYVFPTYQHGRDVVSGSSLNTSGGSQQVGALIMGLSYNVDPKTTINFNVEAGVTNDAPDVHLVLRIPFDLGKIF